MIVLNSSDELKSLRKEMQAIFEARFGKNKFYQKGDRTTNHCIVYFWKLPNRTFQIRSYYVPTVNGGPGRLVKLDVSCLGGGVDYTEEVMIGS